MARLPEPAKPSQIETILVEDSLRLEYGNDSMETQNVEVDISHFMDKFNKEAAKAELETSPEHATPGKPEEKNEPAAWID